MSARHVCFAAWVLLTAASAAGCAQLLSIDNFEDAPGAGGEAAGGGIGGAGGTGVTGGGGSTVGSESCDDRVDNNGDELADCEDPQCQVDHECASAATDDWLGIGWLYSAVTAPDCGLAQRVDLWDAALLNVPPATCACACDPPTDTDCRATLSCSGQSCGGTLHQNVVVSGPCTDFALDISFQHCSAVGLGALPGLCTPVGQIDHDPIDWQPSAALCLYSSGGHCPDSDLCVPSGTTDAEGPCIARQGEHDCPAAYPLQQVVWDGTYDDVRSCSANTCGCASALGATCQCTTSPCGIRDFFSDCSGTAHGFASIPNATCITYGSHSGTPPWHYGTRLEGASVTDPGTCAASGTTALQGEVTPTGRITVCCASDST